MNRQIVSAITFTLLLIGTLTLTFNVPSVKTTGTIYIRADGSVDPPTAPIFTTDNVTYTFISNIGPCDSHGIIIERDNIILDGVGYVLQGTVGYEFNGIVLFGRNNVTVKNMKVEEFGAYGIYVRLSSLSVIVGNNITNNTLGINLRNSSHNFIYGNFITANSQFGVYFSYSSNNTIYENNIINDRMGVFLDYYSSNNIISGNNITANNENGVVFAYSSHNSVYGNKIINNGYGVSLIHSSNNTVYENNVTANSQYGVYLNYYSSNNTVYENNITANNMYGVQINYYSLNNSVYGNNISANGMRGVYLNYYSSNNRIYGNNVSTNNQYGVIFANSSNNTVYENEITNNEYGVVLWDSLNNTVYENNVTSNSYGICLGYSSNNTVCGNNIMNNGAGIDLDSSSNNNTVYHNDFSDNSQQVYRPGGLGNIWDFGYPSGGNYWSDYSGTDQFRGIYQNETGSDGIGDTPKPLFINSSQVDRYPLMGLFGPSTMTGENVTVFPTENVGVIFESVTSAGSTTVSETGTGPAPESGFKIEGQYLDIETTATFSGSITLRIIYDDTDMTQQEEDSLRLMRWNTTTLEWEDITTYVDMENNVIYGETNHLSMFGITSELIHDILVFAVNAHKTVIGRSYSLTIQVFVKNEGDFTETFDITIDLVSGETSYLSMFGITLSNGDTTTVVFNWITAAYATGSYAIVAHASQVPYEIDTADNTCPDGIVKVTIPGDVNGDFYVNIVDATQIGLYWQQLVPPTPANVDVNGDGIINIKDATTIGLNWLKNA